MGQISREGYSQVKIFFMSLVKWCINDNQQLPDSQDQDQIDWIRVLPFILLHLSCLLVFVVGVSMTALCVAFVLYFLRAFAIGAFYHRYFAHRTFKTNRFWQFMFAIIGASATQRGPLWWASHHRQHHLATDTVDDCHSPRHLGFWGSHIKWFLTEKNYRYDSSRIKDFHRFPELRLIDKCDIIVPILLIVLLYFLGVSLHQSHPHLGVSGWQLVIWGYAVSTVFTLHVTLSINSICHLYGKRDHPTKDDSRNNWLFALLALGEGWHNNHHYYPASANLGFKWYQLDMSYCLLYCLEKIGIITDLRTVTTEKLAARLAHIDNE